MRICSFLPSATEIIYLLGLGDSLYAVSHECDYPPEAKAKPKVVRSKIDSANLTSAEIDKAVIDLMASGERIYEVDEDVLAKVKPDIVVTQQLCEVCAVSYEDVERAVIKLEMPPQLISLDPHSLDDVLGDIEKLGQFTATTERANEVIGGLRQRIEAVRSKAANADSRPKVACIEWLDPLIGAGHWIPELVQIAGGVDGLVEPGSPSPRLTIDELAACEPDVLILMPCGWDVARGIKELSLLDGLSEWKGLPAVQQGQVYVVDSGSLFAKSGPRLVEGLELMAQIIHPEIFSESPMREEQARRLDSLPVSA